MAKIDRDIRIKAPPEAVFARLTDLDRLADWATTHLREAKLPDEALHPGQQFDLPIRVAGITLNGRWTIAELDPPRLLVYDVTGPAGSRMRMAQHVAADAEGSRVRFEIEYDLPGGVLGDAVDSLYVERRNEREAEHSLHNLKDVVEAETGGLR